MRQLLLLLTVFAIVSCDKDKKEKIECDSVFYDINSPDLLNNKLPFFCIKKDVPFCSRTENFDVGQSGPGNLFR